MHKNFGIRLATAADVPALAALIELSVRELQTRDYSPVQIELALKTVYGVDTQLIADGTYFAADAASGENLVLVGCGGWSKRKTLFGGDAWNAREDSLLDPRCDAAKIRAFFVHPDWARRGIGSAILDACEDAARAAGFARCEMGATLTGVPFYRTKGYAELEPLAAPLPGGESLPIIRMAKNL
ncbi:MAG TPA: GNAT family N-acetyltransferase [Candidatus Acidoferrales bacterium]|nr:GNAT family N-acetyltransferase [Candidatus Acidoferrales bacterium]